MECTIVCYQAMKEFVQDTIDNRICKQIWTSN